MSASDEEKIKLLIDEYAIKYSIKHHVSIEEARKHCIFKLTEAYYKEDDHENRGYQI